ncbi:MAG: hypothetical protein R2867_22985 [Caldilineaceae bacterium]
MNNRFMPIESGQSGGSGRVYPIRRRRRKQIQLIDPGIPKADNRWYPSRGQARRAALKLAAQLGPGCRIVWHRAGVRGRWPHYHITCPGIGQVSGHLFYGGRVARKMPAGRFGKQRRGQQLWEADQIAGLGPGAIPADITRYFFTMAPIWYGVYGPRLWQLVQRAKQRFLAGHPTTTPQAALQSAALAMHLPRQALVAHPGKLTPIQVQQYRRRQAQRLPRRRHKLIFRRGR